MENKSIFFLYCNLTLFEKWINLTVEYLVLWCILKSEPKRNTRTLNDTGIKENDTVRPTRG
jgi:hypothetical protein